MDELFRLMTVRAPQVTTDSNVVVVTPTSFQPPPPPLGAQLEAFMAQNNYPTPDVSALDLTRASTLYAELKTLSDQLTPTTDGAVLAKAVKTVFGKTEAQLVNLKEFAHLKSTLADYVVALLIGARLEPGVSVSKTIARLVGEAVRGVRVAGLIQRAAATSPEDPLVVAADIQKALAAPVLLPSLVFPLIKLQDLSIQALGYGDLLVVKEHIIGYELGEIARIENILHGETSQHRYEHDLKTSTTTVTTTETDTETKSEIDQTEHVALHNETANTLQEDLSAKGDVHLSYSGVVNVSANAEVSWSQSKNTAARSASDYAKDVTTRASNTVSRKFSQQVTQQITEKLRDVEIHSLSNPNGPGHVRGVYQWVTAVYEAQIFNYGNRILLDMLIPEPGAFLRSTAVQQSSLAAPQAPVAPNFTPDQILDKLPPAPLPLPPEPQLSDYSDPAAYAAALASWQALAATYRGEKATYDAAQSLYWGTLVAQWGLTDFEAPPLEELVLSKVITGSQSSGSTGGGTPGAQTVDIPIKDGFRAARGRCSAMFAVPGDAQDNDYSLTVGIGAIDPTLRSVEWLTEYFPTNYAAAPPAGVSPNRVQGIVDGLIFFSYLGGTFKQPNLEKPHVLFGTVDFQLGYQSANIPVSSDATPPLPSSYVANSGPANPPDEPAVTYGSGSFFRETDSLSVSVFPSLHDNAPFNVHLEVYCERSAKALLDWQVKLFGKIQTVYQKQKQDYDDKVAAQAFQAASGGSALKLGASPDENRTTERTELKKSCIEAMMKPWSLTLDNSHVETSLPANMTATTTLSAPAIVSPPAGFDTITTLLSLSGTGQPGAMVTVADGLFSYGPYLVANDGTWRADTPLSLSFGAHVFVATQVVGALASPPSAPVSGIIRLAAAPFGVELPYPQPSFPLDPDYARAVRFFEQAFEWENLTSFLYPYYWSRKETWYHLNQFSSDDPLHQRFLRAGAARVILPIRPTFNADVLFFLITGKMFISGDVPQLGEPNYFPITDEIKADSDALYDPVPVPDEPPWEVRIPTRFIWLRKDDRKPAWKPRNQAGWQPPEPANWSWESNPSDPFDDGE